MRSSAAAPRLRRARASSSWTRSTSSAFRTAGSCSWTRCTRRIPAGTGMRTHTRTLFARGAPQRELDKEYLRQWLLTRGWKGDGAPPEIPDEVRVEVARKYIDGMGNHHRPAVRSPCAWRCGGIGPHRSAARDTRETSRPARRPGDEKTAYGSCTLPHALRCSLLLLRRGAHGHELQRGEPLRRRARRTEYREFDPARGKWSTESSSCAWTPLRGRAQVRAGGPDILLLQEVENENALHVLGTGGARDGIRVARLRAQEAFPPTSPS